MILLRMYQKVQRYYLIKKDPIAFAKKIGVNIGENCRLLGIDDRTFGSEPYLITIGNHVTVTGQVKFINHDGGVWVFREPEKDMVLIKPITVGDNVFLGFRSIIMPGVNIGSNVVIGAGSLVIADIPSNSVAAGVPARVIRSVEDYRNKINPFVMLSTWHSPEEKRNILLEHFGVKNHDEQFQTDVE